MVEPLPERPVLPRPAHPDHEPYQVHPAVFSPRQCDRVVRLGRSLPADDAAVENADDRVPLGSLRDARTSWIPPGEETAWIFAKLAAVATRANRSYRYDLSGFEEDLQFTTYGRPGAFYTWHQDGLDGTVAHRKLSMVLQLTDPAEYEGAELDFLALDGLAHASLDAARSEMAAQGSLIVFPSFEYHRVLPLRSGTRHSLVCWVSGPPFR